MTQIKTKENDSSRSQKFGFAGWEKWALMSVIILGLSSVIVYFNFRVFGMADGWPYTAVVAFIVLLSLIVTRHVKQNPVTTNFLRAAFIFEVLLCVVLCLNVVYSLSVMREMSVAGQNEKEWREAIDSVSKLRGRNNQKQALQQLKQDGYKIQTRQEVFVEKEQVLFWIMMAELTVALLATFVLLGYSVFDRNNNGVMDFLEDVQPGFVSAKPIHRGEDDRQIINGKDQEENQRPNS